MKPISKKKQRILAFIPWLNLFCLPIFIYNSFFVNFTFKDYLRGWIYLIFPAVFVVGLREIIVAVFPVIGFEVGHICNYLVMLIVGLRLAKYQEQFF